MLFFNKGELPLIAEEGDDFAVVAREDFHAALASQLRCGFGVGAARNRVRNRLGDGFDVVFQLHACLHDLELHRTNSGHDWCGIATQVVAQNLHNTFGRQLFQALAECLVLAQRLCTQDAEDLWCELRHGCKLHLLARVNGVTRCQSASVDQTDDVTGVSHVNGIAVAAEDGQRVLGGE